MLPCLLVPALLAQMLFPANAAAILLAAPKRAQPHAPSRKPPRGRLLRTIPNRATLFYSFRDKNGKTHKMASVSNTVKLPVVLPAAPKKKAGPAGQAR